MARRLTEEERARGARLEEEQAGLYKWVENRSVDGVALDGNPFDDEWIVSVGGSPGILANVSSAGKRTAFLAGLNASEAQLGKKIAAAGGVLSESS